MEKTQAGDGYPRAPRTKPKQKPYDAIDLLQRVVYDSGIHPGERVTHRRVRIVGEMLQILRREGYCDEDGKLTPLGWQKATEVEWTGQLLPR